LVLWRLRAGEWRYDFPRPYSEWNAQHAIDFAKRAASKRRGRAKLNYVGAFWTTLLILWPLATGLAEVPELTPEPKLSPEQVVAYQVGALQHNDDPRSDAGIERVFRFASPSNREVTGPLKKFVSIVKSPAYSPMVNNLASSIVGSRIEGDHAKVAIKVTPENGPQLTYLFVLTKQHEGQFSDCWMTDSVVPMREGENLSDDAIAI
jgi:hypothetical protein